DVLREDHRITLRVQADQEIPDPAEAGIEGREERVVEDVIEVRAHLQLHMLREGEGFMNAEVDSPRARPGEEVAPRDFRIIEQVSPRRRQREGGLVEEPVAREAGLPVPDDERAVTVRLVEIAERINKPAADIPRADVATIIALPEGGEAGAALGEEVPGQIPAPGERVGPRRNVIAEHPVLPVREFVDAVRNEA